MTSTASHRPNRRRIGTTIGAALAAAAFLAACTGTLPTPGASDSSRSAQSTGYSGQALPSRFLSTDFSGGFEVAWEMSATDLGANETVATTAVVDGTLVALTGPYGSEHTLIGLDVSGPTPTVLWTHQFTGEYPIVLAWGDSLVAGNQTIRASDGTVTATWQTPLPSEASSYMPGQPLLLVGEHIVDQYEPRIVPVAWPLAVTCLESTSSSGRHGADYDCAGWRQDGTQAWTYTATSTYSNTSLPGLPSHTRAANGYIPISRTGSADIAPISQYLRLEDGTITEGATLEARHYLIASDGYISSGVTNRQPRETALVTVSPDGTEQSTSAVASTAMPPEDLAALLCWSEDGTEIIPTVEQATETIATGQAPWATLCATRNGIGSLFAITALNGRDLTVTSTDGKPIKGAYATDLIPSRDGSLILSREPDGAGESDSVLHRPHNLYAVPSGNQLATLEEFGVHGVTAVYEDLLVAVPTPSYATRNSPSPSHRKDTVLMGITPKRAG